mmetsp:Transcript_2633/g.4799  ORF Transcript_2633/g.4799 Transcript_2633/m.4799 type:complete len:313 (-) Transcript_2633:302-1240(-)|eukprot:CAMPEP_0196658490 /NCGR_PEP_ID=MMETSP1086-20130531/29933_1 /TAXON_ID=77921 /ORGANISM="Cyanoptyche  gloeocystis , Strain SAG4.97" /LENGTH=312 /DNA_ID=CAMNT_0041992093 /DNA_START=127 /DNA_END=1065 /DNA_ORIENTATION=+
MIGAIALGFLVGIPIITCVLVFLFLHNPAFWAYLAFSFFLDRRARKGGKVSVWLRNAACWQWMRDYFPASLEKEVPLDAEKNYILCCHPHGMITLSALLNFATNATGVDEVLPGVRVRMTCLPAMFKVPWMRELFLLLGACEAKAQSITAAVSEGKGNAVSVTLGGVDEMMAWERDRINLVVRKRTRIFDIALRTGASLVPVFMFGETDLLQPLSVWSWPVVHRLQTVCVALTGFPLPLFCGRRLFTLPSWLPNKNPLTAILGPPLHVERTSTPSSAQVSHLQSRYIAALTDLFHRHRARFLSSPQLLSVVA